MTLLPNLAITLPIIMPVHLRPAVVLREDHYSIASAVTLVPILVLPTARVMTAMIGGSILAIITSALIVMILAIAVNTQADTQATVVANTCSYYIRTCFRVLAMPLLSFCTMDATPSCNS